MNKISNIKTFLEFLLVITSILFLGSSFLPKQDISKKQNPLLKPILPPKPDIRPILPWRKSEDSDPIETISLGGKIAPDNQTEVQIDFPLTEHITNIGSKKDGAGMCVMSSIEMAARWSNLESMRGLRDWCAKEPGGGWPEKVDKQLAKYVKEFKVTPKPSYIQYEGKDPQILRAALETGRFPAITYSGKDKVRYSGTIAHMVCLAHLDDNFAAIWDNNGKPGELIWMNTKEFMDRWTDGSSGWTFIWISPPPPPLPTR